MFNLVFCATTATSVAAVALYAALAMIATFFLIGKLHGLRVTEEFVYDVENVVKIRTGEKGYDALQEVE